MLDSLIPHTDIPTTRTIKYVAYLIRVRGSKMVYVGSTSEPGKRVSAHRGHLRRGAHDNRALQALYNQNEHVDFVFYEVADRAAAYELEKALIWHFKEKGELLNVMLDPVNNTKTPEQLLEFRKAATAKAMERAKRISVHGVIYESVRHAARALKLSKSSVANRASSKMAKYKAWYFVDDVPKVSNADSYKSNAVLVTVDGITYTLREYSVKTGIAYQTLQWRKKLNVPDNELHLPVKRTSKL